jgi:EAL domain-containing protein (putative c-di-GMP-specific phosphodiesterase class I)
MNARLELRRDMAAELAAALPAGQFELFYQPFVDTATRRPVGFEALLRWRHPVRGLVPPDQFIPLAEETAEIVAIGAWVLHQACAEAAAWPGNVRIAVNLSPAQFRRQGLVEAVADALDRSGLAPDRLELELTENVLLADTPETAAIIGRLRGLGVTLVMDDFGTGYSSLAYLHRFRFDKVKIDRSFIAALGRRREGLAIVRAIIGICRHLDMTALAEGVETEDQLGVLRSERCVELQGFLFGRPAPLETARAMLAALAPDATPPLRLASRV